MQSNAEVAAIAKSLGHTDLAVIESGRGNTWSSACSCGWRSSRSYVLVAPAVQEAQAHLRKVASEHRRVRRTSGLAAL